MAKSKAENETNIQVIGRDDSNLPHPILHAQDEAKTQSILLEDYNVEYSSNIVTYHIPRGWRRLGRLRELWRSGILTVPFTLVMQ